MEPVDDLDYAEETPNSKVVDGKRRRRPTQKALQNALEKKRREISSLHIRLRKVVEAARGPDDARDNDIVLRDLTEASERLYQALQELVALHEKGDYGDLEEETLFIDESLLLKSAYRLIDKIKATRNCDKLSETSRHSRRSSRASIRSTSTPHQAPQSG